MLTVVLNCFFAQQLLVSFTFRLNFFSSKYCKQGCETDTDNIVFPCVKNIFNANVLKVFVRHHKFPTIAGKLAQAYGWGATKSGEEFSNKVSSDVMQKISIKQ